jgi:hypothetical protein
MLSRIPQSLYGLSRRGVSLEQQRHRSVMFQSRFWYVALVLNGSTTRLIAPLLAILLRGRGPLPSAAEGLRPALCFTPAAESGIM